MSAPTVSAGLTGAGAILGTLQYMAPEQLEGTEADARTDIFAFGALVYEMATGQKAFSGESQASLIVAILDRDPVPMSTLQPVTPARLDGIVKTCLAKDPDDRWQSAGDIGRLVTGISEGGSQTGVAVPPVAALPRARWRLAVPWVAGLVLGSVITGLAVWSLTRPDPRVTARFTVPLPTNMRLGQFVREPLALSPDGRTLVYVAESEDGVTRLYRRPLDQLDAMLIPGTEDATDPFFSPTGESVGFFARLDRSRGTLRTVSLAGGPPVTLWEGALSQGASWGPDDTIVLGEPGPHGDERASLWQISTAGGEPASITTVDLDGGEEAHAGPEFLPGGRAVLFMVEYASARSDWVSTTQIAVLSLDTGERQMLLQGTQPHYVPDGHIVYVRGDSLWRVPFDAERLEVTGQAVPVQEPVHVASNATVTFTVGGGTLAYRPGIAEEPPATRTLVWVDREGREEPLGLPPKNYEWPRVAPDGTRVAVAISESENVDIWVSEWERGTLSKVTTDPGFECCPLWTPGGDRVVFRSTQEGQTGLFWKAPNGRGAAEPLLAADAQILSPHAWSPDGKKLLIYYQPADFSTPGIWVLSLDGDRSWEPLLRTAGEFAPALSPDGSWLAYASDETGRPEVYVERFPTLGDRRQISTGGGVDATWSSDGRELFYLRAGAGGANAMMIVSVSIEPEFTLGTPQVLFEREVYTGGGRRYDVAPDGRFLMIKPGVSASATSSAAETIVVENWSDELQRLVPTP